MKAITLPTMAVLDTLQDFTDILSAIQEGGLAVPEEAYTHVKKMTSLAEEEISISECLDAATYLVQEDEVTKVAIASELDAVGTELTVPGIDEAIGRLLVLRALVRSLNSPSTDV